jgi:hypothetical protein
MGLARGGCGVITRTIVRRDVVRYLISAPEGEVRALSCSRGFTQDPLAVFTARAARLLLTVRGQVLEAAGEDPGLGRVGVWPNRA